MAPQARKATRKAKAPPRITPPSSFKPDGPAISQSALRTMKSLVRHDGVVVVMDERTEEHFQAPASPLERMLYGFSLVCCLPDGRSHDPSVATGTVMRPQTLNAYAKEAGFKAAETLPIDHEAFRFYQLTF